MSFHLTKPDPSSIFPTFSSFVSGHKKLTLAIFSLYFATIILAVSLIALANRQITSTGGIDGTGVSIPLLTAYGSQRHVFAGQDGSLRAVWVNSNKQIVGASSADGVNWQEATLAIQESAENVSGAQDQNGDLHLAYESDGRIIYRKVGHDWSVSNAVPLDTSGMAHRPSLILENSGLPAVAWSSQGRGAVARNSRILFLRAKADPVSLGNWCNVKITSCGIPAYSFTSGSADAFSVFGLYTLLHPVLAQMPQTGDFYLFWSEAKRQGNTLRLAIARKESGFWKWGTSESQDEVGEETFKNFTLAAVDDHGQNQVVIAYVGKDGLTKAISYKADGGKSEISPNQNVGSQFSLASGEGREFLFYRKENGKIGLRQYDGVWSGEILETGEGGYPSAVEKLIGGKLFFVYTTVDGKVQFSSYSLPLPTPTQAPTQEPTATPTLAPEATPALEPTATPTPPASD